MTCGQLVPLAFLRGEQELHEVGADGEVVAVAGDDEAGKVADRIGGGIENGGDEGENVAADGVLERVQLDAGDAVAEIDERSAGVGADDASCARRKSATRAWPGIAGMGIGSGRLPAGSRRRRSGEYQLVREAASRACDGSADGQVPRAFMRATVSATPAASHISKGPSSQLKPARMAASMEGASSATSPMRSAAKFQSEARNGQRKAAALSLAGSFASSRRRRSGSVAAFFAISSEGRAGFGGGTVFEGGEIEDEALVFAVGTADLLVEALAGFVAEPAALQHFVEDGGEFAAGDALREVGGDVGEDVDADEIGEAKGAGARPADGGAGERVDFFDGEALLEHEVGGVEHDRDADAVGDEVGRVVREDDLLAEDAIGEGGEGGDDGGIGCRGWG